jgi:hypothetical protein
MMNELHFVLLAALILGKLGNQVILIGEVMIPLGGAGRGSRWSA